MDHLCHTSLALLQLFTFSVTYLQELNNDLRDKKPLLKNLKEKLSKSDNNDLTVRCNSGLDHFEHLSKECENSEAGLGQALLNQNQFETSINNDILPWLREAEKSCRNMENMEGLTENVEEEIEIAKRIEVS